MAMKPRDPKLLQETLDAVRKYGAVKTAARKLGIPYPTFQHRWEAAVQWEKNQKQRPAPMPPEQALAEALVARLRKGPVTLHDLATLHGLTQGRILDALLKLRAGGLNLHELGGAWCLERQMPVGAGTVTPYRSRPDGSYYFGFISDTHLGSKYARLDVLTDLYRKFAAAGVDRVFHAGNWIDGEARFNKFDLLVHGMERQIEYCVKHHPQAGDLVTYAVTGDDHEGWYGQREGIDIGRLLERSMRDAGRADWVNLGYMEAYVPLEHAASGKTSMLHVIHPGGGSAYATSYTVQKIVEGYESGNKPAVLLAGHYHKLEFINIRGVWVVQTGCVQDQTPFLRKKKIQVAIGGGIMRLTQNPKTGAIEHAGVDMFCFWDRGYYQNQRWSMSGDVVLTPRVPA
jgi:predicted phosphodiesterase